jgi:hypothetical protein
MSPHNDFTILFDEQARIIVAKMRGFWPQETLLAFNDQMAAAIRTASARRSAFGILADATEFGVQSAMIAEGFARNESNDTTRPSGPLAFVVSSTLVKMQATRMLTNAYEVFTDLPAGRKWLEGILSSLK